MDTFQKLLRVDLTKRHIEKETIPPDITHSYLGGKGLNVYYLLKYVTNTMKPLSPETPLIFSNGLLT